jgi:hypothetical protein
MLRRRALALLVVTLAGFGTAAAMASVSIAPAQATRQQARLKVGVSVLRFAAAGRRTTATGLVSATLTDNRGRRTTVHSKVAITAATGRSCRILHLFLKELNLQLLGLTAHLDKVTLDITGQPHGGVLGSLFCKLARAKVAMARVSAVRALNAQVRRHQGSMLRFSANLSPQSTARAAGSVCPVLDLIVGPLNLQLLGLVVDLQKVHLNVTATRGGGALGDLFCRLADNSTTTTTSSTT